MDDLEKKVVQRFHTLIARGFPDAQLTLFGSRARHDANPDSDMDILIVLETDDLPHARRFVSDCAWEAGFFVHI